MSHLSVDWVCSQYKSQKRNNIVDKSVSLSYDDLHCEDGRHRRDVPGSLSTHKECS